MYIGSASTGSTGLLNYFNPNILSPQERNLPVYNNYRSSMRRYARPSGRRGQQDNKIWA